MPGHRRHCGHHVHDRGWRGNKKRSLAPGPRRPHWRFTAAYPHARGRGGRDLATPPHNAAPCDQLIASGAGSSHPLMLPPLPPSAEPPAPPTPSPALLVWSPKRLRFKRLIPRPPRRTPPVPPVPPLPPRPAPLPALNIDITVRAGSSSTRCPSISAK